MWKLKSMSRSALFGWGAMLLTVGLMSSVALAQTARYRLTFESTWSEATHPGNLPPGPHFSGLIGATHNGDVSFWQVGQLATPGIEAMAELGSKSPLTSEIDAAFQQGQAHSLINGAGISSPGGRTSPEFEVDTRFPLVTAVSMIAPSPDWFVGVAGLNLRPAGDWLSKVVIPLHLYDAGTDSGATFTSANADTQPPELIAAIVDGPLGTSAAPFGTFTLVRLLEGDFDQSGDLTAADIDQLSVALRDGVNDVVYDLDRDGFVTDSDRVYWVEQLAGSLWGDTNLDGLFNSNDLIDALQAAEYQDALTGNSTWATGDWDGDGDFLSDDLILALSTGAYELGSQASVRAVPEPTTLGMIMSATALVFVGGRRHLRGAADLLDPGSVVCRLTQFDPTERLSDDLAATHPDNDAADGRFSASHRVRRDGELARMARSARRRDQSRVACSDSMG